jgi:hypothetical protein
MLVQLKYTHVLATEIMLSLGHRLSEGVSNHEVSFDILKLNILASNTLAGKVVDDINML